MAPSGHTRAPGEKGGINFDAGATPGGHQHGWMRCRAKGWVFDGSFVAVNELEHIVSVGAQDIQLAGRKDLWELPNGEGW